MMNLLEAIDNKIRNRRYAINLYRTINDLPLTEMQTRCVLEWFAWKIWEILMELEIEDGYGKLYDPLVIEKNECHSYVFDLGDGGRHHKYETLMELEERLKKEMVERIRKERGKWVVWNNLIKKYSTCFQKDISRI